jgi:hypothetical protein
VVESQPLLELYQREVHELARGSVAKEVIKMIAQQPSSIPGTSILHPGEEQSDAWQRYPISTAMPHKPATQKSRAIGLIALLCLLRANGTTD